MSLSLENQLAGVHAQFIITVAGRWSLKIYFVKFRAGKFVNQVINFELPSCGILPIITGQYVP